MDTAAKIIVILFCFYPSLGLSDEVIDLGTLQVEGEVRRPPVQFFVSKKVPDSVIKKTANKSFENLEQELLVEVPASPEKKPKKDNRYSK